MTGILRNPSGNGTERFPEWYGTIPRIVRNHSLPPSVRCQEAVNLIVMPYYKKKQKKINGKWYPQSVTVGDPVTTDEIAQLLADFSSASVGDTYNILKNLARAMSIYMSNGRSVKLDGVGTFYYTLTAAGQGVDTPEEVNANQIVGVRVRFLPEYSRASDHTATRALVPDKLKWEEWGGEATGSTTPGTGGEDGDDSGQGTFG